MGKKDVARQTARLYLLIQWRKVKTGQPAKGGPTRVVVEARNISIPNPPARLSSSKQPSIRTFNIVM